MNRDANMANMDSARKGALPGWLGGALVCVTAWAVILHYYFFHEPWAQGLFFNMVNGIAGPYHFNDWIVSGRDLLFLGLGILAMLVAFVWSAPRILNRWEGWRTRLLVLLTAFGGGVGLAAVLWAMRIRPNFGWGGAAWVWYGVGAALILALGFFPSRNGFAWGRHGLLFVLGLAAGRGVEPLAWSPVLWAMIGWLGLCLWTGWWLLDWWDGFMPRGAAVATAFVLGVTVCGLLTEGLAMAGLFRRWPIVIGGMALLAGIGAVRHVRRRRSFHGVHTVDPELLRRQVLQEVARRYQASMIGPHGWSERVIWWTACFFTAMITALTFYHGMGYAETYWDSLILYLGYARMTFLEEGFPFKAVAQVGIGLGANYPHLYPTLVATGPALAGTWDAIGGQMAAPLAGVLSCVLAYHTVLYLTRRPVTAMVATLAFRALPFGIYYSIYASDYAYAILFAMAIIYLGVLYMDTASPAYLIAQTFMCAGASHINYLMLAMWGVWATTIFLTHCRRGVLAGHIRDRRRASGRSSLFMCQAQRGEFDEAGEIVYDDALMYLEDYPRPGLRDLLSANWFWGMTTAGLLMASTWYVRNQVLTGNPVYSFFSEFLGGIRINPEVLESARVEWMQNGGGMGNIAHALPDVGYRDLTVWHKLRYGPWYFYGASTAWRYQPILYALVVPGMLAMLWVSLAKMWARLRWREDDLDSPAPSWGTRLGGWLADPLGGLETWERAGLLGFVLVGGFLTYHIAMADFYLYQILPAMAAFPIFYAWGMGFTDRPGLRELMAAAVVATAVGSGLPVALMGGKVSSPAPLVALHHPGMTDDEVLMGCYDTEWRFLPDGSKVTMFADVNRICAGKPLLTHENRHVLYDPSIPLVHLDDWETQALWGRPAEDVVRGLKAMGIEYYLYIPNEDKHAVNARLGMKELIRDGWLAPVLEWNGEGKTGPGSRVLYRWAK